MQIIDSRFTSKLDSNDVYTEQVLKCVNPNCDNKGNREKVITKVS